MTIWILGGTAAGVIIGIVAGYQRGRAVGIACSLLVASAIWSAAAIGMGNRADEMSGIPYLVGGALTFWVITLPALVAVIMIELRRKRKNVR